MGFAMRTALCRRYSCFGTDEKEFQNNLDMFYECSELWHLSINFDTTTIMIFGTRQDQRSNFNLGGHKIDICTDFKYLGVILAKWALPPNK